MGSDPSLALFLADALVDQPVHAPNELVAGEPDPGIDRTAELAIDNVADAFQTRRMIARKDCVAFWL